MNVVSLFDFVMIVLFYSQCHFVFIFIFLIFNFNVTLISDPVWANVLSDCVV